MRKSLCFIGILSGVLVVQSCNPDELMTPPAEEIIYKIPVVVHIVHLGESVGEGTNLSAEQIESQIRVLNEDYRRKEGTRGYNNHPDGGDARIEFVLAKTDPYGYQTNGTVRIDAAESGQAVQFRNREYYASLSYWNPEHYLNIWTEPMPDDLIGIVLGEATGPQTDLPGAELFLQGEPLQPEGILINAAHFGESEIDSDYNLGRTLTHEAGHYLGLLHTWGTRDCDTNDYCDDTPPVTKEFSSIACDGTPAMRTNYMTYSHDIEMNVFTKNQITRMRYVLENSPYQNTLSKSSGLQVP